MQNLPMFTTQNGVASLTLREIPYTKNAYITVQDALNIAVLCQECVGFCKAVGAERVFITGTQLPDGLPLHTEIWEMHRQIDGLPQTDACLIPVQEGTINKWKSIYNRAMTNIPNAAYFTDEDCKKLLADGNGYFVHRGESILGIGIVSENEIKGIVALQPGNGQDVLLALISALSSGVAALQVASCNYRAVRLYERLGFIKTKEISKWYQIF